MWHAKCIHLSFTFQNSQDTGQHFMQACIHLCNKLPLSSLGYFSSPSILLFSLPCIIFVLSALNNWTCSSRWLHFLKKKMEMCLLKVLGFPPKLLAEPDNPKIFSDWSYHDLYGFIDTWLAPVPKGSHSTVTILKFLIIFEQEVHIFNLHRA